MTPVASTSRATAPATPSQVPVSTPVRSRLSRKGKEKAVYTPPTYDFDDPSVGSYQPRSGQLQRRKKTPKSNPTEGAKSKLSRSSRQTRRKSNADGVLGVETIKIGATVEKKQEEGDAQPPPKKKRKNLELDSSTTRSRFDDPEAPSSQPDLLSPSILRTRKKSQAKEKKKGTGKEKKSVRLDLPVPITSMSSSSTDDEYGSGDNDTFRPDSGDESATPSTNRARRTRSSGPLDLASAGVLDDDEEEDEQGRQAREAALDYSNPSNLPRTNMGHQQRRTSRKYWRGLEYGMYRSALYDAVSGGGRDEGGQNDLARLVWGWQDLVRRQRREEERNGQLVEDAAADDEAEGKKEKRGKGRPRMPRAPINERSGSATPRTPRRRTRSNTDDYVSTNEARGEDDTTMAATERANRDGGAEAEEDTLEVPKSQILEGMARWPLYPIELMNYFARSGQRVDLHSELEVLAEQTRRETAAARVEGTEAQPRPRRRHRRKVPSAYATMSSQATGVRATEDNADESDSSCSSLDLPSPPSIYPPSFLEIPNTINSILTRLGDFVPKEPLPALDIWSVRAREDGMRQEKAAQAKINKKEGRGKILRDKAPGWREVVAVARESDAVPKQ